MSGGSISANVGSSLISASASGGIGPQGSSGAAGGLLEQLQDVLMSSVADGDVLRYSNTRWRNTPETSITDGGNF